MIVVAKRSSLFCLSINNKERKSFLTSAEFHLTSVLSINLALGLYHKAFYGSNLLRPATQF